jgi:hypothetical protein
MSASAPLSRLIFSLVATAILLDLISCGGGRKHASR